MTLETEPADFAALTQTLKDLNTRLTFSPFLAGAKLTFCDVLMAALVRAIREINEVEYEKIVKSLDGLNRVANYVEQFLVE